MTRDFPQAIVDQRITHRRSSLLATMAAGMMLTAVAPVNAQADIEEITAAARAEGTLTIYTSSVDSETQAYVQAFNQLYPEIEVSWIRLTSATLFSRFIGEVEANAPQADIIASGSSLLMQERPELFVDLAAADLPNNDDRLQITPKTPSYAVVSVSPHVVTYNNTMIAQEDVVEHMRDWKDFADPFWQGKISILDPLATTNYMSWYKVMRDEYGDDYLRALAANSVGFASSGAPASQQAAAGAFAVAFPTTVSHSAEVRAAGAPISIARPEGPAHAVEASIGIPANAPHPNAALLWTNFMMSNEAQELICGFGGSVPVASGVGGPDCPKLSPRHVGSIDVIPETEQAEILRLLGINQ